MVWFSISTFILIQLERIFVIQWIDFLMKYKVIFDIDQNPKMNKK